MTALVIAEHDNFTLQNNIFNIVTAALQVSDDVHILIVGYNIKNIAKLAAKIFGVSQVLLADSPTLANHLAENITAQILIIAKNYSHIFAAATSYGKNILPRLAAKLNVAQISEIIKIHNVDTFERFIYAGNAIAIVQSTDFIKVITVRHTNFNPTDSIRGHATIKLLEIVNYRHMSTVVSRKIVIESNRPELTTAKIVVSGGRGIGSADNFKILEKLANKLHAALGASRAAVDSGFISNDCQVGQTGKTVAPQLYIAIGISGAIQHLAGMKDSKIIVAINKDQDAPIFTVADYGIVADLFKAVPEFIEKLN